jgi:hypothetical protein
MLATDGIWHESDSAGEEWRALERAVLIASLVVALALGIFLCARRMSGAITLPLAPTLLICTAATMLLWSLILRLRLRFSSVGWLAALALALFAVACSFPGERAIDWIIWLAVAAVYGVVPTTSARRSSPAAGRMTNGSPDLLVQQVSRSRTVEGGEFAQGMLVAEFTPGERTSTLYVAFCPPFLFLPTVDAEPVDGPDCSVKIVQVLHQGARFEVRLTRASTTPQRIRIEFVAIETPPLAV